MTITEETSVYPEICQSGLKPLLLDGLIRQLLITHFSTADNIESEELKSRLFSSTPPTGILIEEATTWTPKETEKRPAVIIKRNDWQSKRIIIGDFSQSRGAVDIYMRHWVGSHTLFCLSRSGAEATLLATEVVYFLLEYTPGIKKYLDTRRFQITGIGGISKLEEARDTFVIPVSFEYAIEVVWGLQPV